MSRRTTRALFGAWLLAVEMSTPAFAQVRPTVFLHGLTGAAADWTATAARLRNTVALEPHVPDLPWRSVYEQQASDLQGRSEYSALPSNTVALGHSNGGIVAREWSKLHHLDGIVTIGTPHQGAPLMGRINSWASYMSKTPTVLNTVVDAFSQTSEWSWVFSEVADLLGWTSDFSLWSVANLASSLGLRAGLPVSGQMVPQSSYLTALNSPSNLAREASQIPNRVGIASIAHNYYYAGPARAVAPDYADIVATSMYAAAFGLFAWADYIFFEASPLDATAMAQATSLMSVAGFILSIDPTYCRMVSRFDMSECLPNDGIVAVDSQAYPNAPNLLIGHNNDGPAHVQERDGSDDALYLALTTYMHLPPRNPSAPVAPTPAPAPAPDPISTPEPPPVLPSTPSSPPDTSSPDPGTRSGPVTLTNGLLMPNQILWPGDTVDSTEGRRHLAYQGDGNLVIYDEHWLPLWASDTPGTRAGVVAMQGDGNLGIYDPDGVPLWASGVSAGHPGAYLAVQNDGNVVIYDVDGTPLWATGTF